MSLLSFSTAHRGLYPTFGAGKPAKPKAEPKTPEQSLADLDTYLGKVSETRTINYRKTIQKVLDDAKAFLEKYLQKNKAEDGAVVLDLDETLLDNSANLMMRKLPSYAGYNSYVSWMQSAQAPAIPETKNFVDWVREKGFKVYFVTARKDFVRSATIRNLDKIGLPEDTYAGLYTKPNGFKGTNPEFKVGAQQDIEANKGQKVLMLLGDQDSDGEGCLGKFFKLPNDLYSA